jgi:hypothetical protein
MRIEIVLISVSDKDYANTLYSLIVIIRRHDTQHNDIQPNDIQHKGLMCDIEDNGTQHNENLPLC